MSHPRWNLPSLNTWEPFQKSSHRDAATEARKEARLLHPGYRDQPDPAHLANVFLPGFIRAQIVALFVKQKPRNHFLTTWSQITYDLRCLLTRRQTNTKCDLCIISRPIHSRHNLTIKIAQLCYLIALLAVWHGHMMVNSTNTLSPDSDDVVLILTC